MSITAGGLLFNTFEFRVAKPGEQYTSKPKAGLFAQDTSNGCTVGACKEITRQLAAAQVLTIAASELGTPTSGFFTIAMIVRYDSLTTTAATQNITVNKDAEAASSCQWRYVNSFDTSIVITNTTANPIEVEIVIFDVTSNVGF